MRGLAIRWILNAFALFFTAWLIPGIELNGLIAALFTAFVLGIVNAVIRPIVLLFTLPLNILTLGLFTLVVNASMMLIASSVVKGFEVTGFWSAFFGAIVLTLVSGLISGAVLDHSGKRRF